MKAKFFMLAAAAFTLSLASCQKDDSAGVITPDMETSYAKVKILFGGNGTRAFGGYDKGTEAEAKVHNLTLLFFSGEDLVGSGSASPEVIAENQEGNVTNKYEAVIKVALDPGSAKPDKMYAYVNTSAPYSTLTAAEGAKTAELGDAANGFAMTLSGYYDKDNAWVSYYELKDGDLANTEKEAEDATAIELYVERLAAKVKADVDASADKNCELVFVGVDDAEYTLVFEPRKWSVTGKAKDMYVNKQQFDVSLSWALAATDYRSFWAKGTLYEEDYEAFPNALSWLSANQFISNSGAESRNFTDAKDALYVTEHTVGEALKAGTDDASSDFDGKMAATGVIVAGKYSITGNGAENFKDGENYDFYLTMKGVQDGVTAYNIYSKADLINRLIALSGYTLSTSSAQLTEIEDVTDYFDLAKNENGKYALKLIGETVYYENGDSYAEADDDLFAEFVSNAKHYLEGWAYFIAPIEHNNALDNHYTEGYYGVVRNHSYSLNITAFKGLGAPLDEGKIGSDPENHEPDPDDPEPDPGEDPIVPDPDDIKNAYISATLNVLAWHTVDQEVEF